MGAPRKLITVSGSEHGIELLDFLAKRLAVSNKQAKRLLDGRFVFVGNRRIWMARHRLAAGDRVEVQTPTVSPEKTEARIAILYEDPDYLIVDKPSGRLSNGPDSVESQLRSQLRRDVYAVHRLDRDTSGCLLLAFSVAAREAMKELFQARDVTKRYHALAIGRVPRSLPTLRGPIDGQTAVTHVRVLKALPAASLLELELETGRTHQIRKHLSGAGHPVVGDKEYLTVAMDEPALRHVPRQMLHATELAFARPGDGRRIAARAPWPADFKACAARLQLGGPTPGAAPSGRH